jgi:pimeloyl-ACP methyl ester carboxylesterase
MKTAKSPLNAPVLFMTVLLLSVLPFFGRAETARPSTAAFGEFVRLSTGQKIWVEGEFIGADRPTKVILNGLTNSASKSFYQLSKAFVEKGYNVVRFDFPGQAKTLYANLNLPQDFSYQAQVRVIKELLPIIVQRLGLKTKLDILGQSYGAGILLATLGLEPEFSQNYLRSAIAFAPYTEPLRNQDESIREEMKWWRTYYPQLPYTDQELYDLIFYRIVMSQYAVFEPEIIGLTPEITTTNLWGVYELGRGMRPLKAAELIGTMPATIPVNIIKAESDQYIPGDVIPAFWKALPSNKKGIFINVYSTEHKMLQVVPQFSADISEILATPPRLFPRGTMLEGYVMTHRLHKGSQSYDISDLLDAVRRRPLLSAKKVVELEGQVGASTLQCRDLFAIAN